MASKIATYNAGQIISKEAGVNVTAYRFVKNVTPMKVSRTTVSGERADGVAKFTADAGDEAAVMRGGTVPVEAAEALNEGDEIMTDVDGRAVAAVGAGKLKLGKITNGSSAAAAGDIVSVDLYTIPQVAV